jgi:hypothetical protein
MKSLSPASSATIELVSISPMASKSFFGGKDFTSNHTKSGNTFSYLTVFYLDKDTDENS